MDWRHPHTRKLIAIIHVSVGGATYEEGAYAHAASIAYKRFEFVKDVVSWDDKYLPEDRSGYEVIHDCMTGGLATWAYSFMVFGR